MKAKDRIMNLLFVTKKPLSGFQISQICGLGSWRLYPALTRLENDGLITGDWEDAAVPGAPRRRVYQLSRFIP